MAIHIEELEIGAFRGIRQLSVPRLNHINIVAGDNNCGKTSFLEALMLLRNVSDLNNVFRVARRRDIPALIKPPFFDRFLSLFPVSEEPTGTLEMVLRANCSGKENFLKLKGHLSTVILEDGPHYRYRRPGSKREDESLEVRAFLGGFFEQIGGKHHQEPVMIHEYIYKSSIIREKQNIVYLAPFDHLRGDTFGRILRNDGYKELCIHILRLFDPGIIDLLLLRDETMGGGQAAEYIKHRDLGTMPLTSYGDGIKKVLSIASGVAQAVGGVLLIDEVETAIHSKYFEDIFRFIVSACVRFHVQLFVTSHSMEAIDGFLATQDYDKKPEGKEDILSVITLKKEGKASFSRVLDGEQVYRNREAFGFEVRL